MNKNSSLLILYFTYLAVCGATTLIQERGEHLNIKALQKLTPENITSILTENPEIQFKPVVYACANIPAPAPTDSIHALKPGHIKVVMAMGDSITAGMSAKDTSVLSMKEYRGISFSIGGDAGAITMPNILKQFSPSVIGFSTGIGKRPSTGNGLNGAESGDINLDMYSQAQWLVNAMKTDKRINLNEDWKMLTIWIGSNNLCDVCDNDARNNADDFHTNLVQALDYLRENVPRLFVNLLSNLDITQIYDIKDGMCGILHPIACACAASSDASVRANVKKVNLEYQVRAQQIADLYNSDTSHQFVVVAQPFLTNSKVSSRSFLSAADCFHPSLASHQYASVALWNNMITPKAQKATAWDPATTVVCPTESTLLYTN